MNKKGQIETKNTKAEKRKLVLWIVASCFGLLFSFMLLVKLPELKVLWPSAFDNNIVGVLFLLVMMICVALIAYAAFLYRSLKFESEQDEIKSELSEMKKGFEKNAPRYITFGIFRKYYNDTRTIGKNVSRATSIRIVLASVLILVRVSKVTTD